MHRPCFLLKQLAARAAALQQCSSGTGSRLTLRWTNKPVWTAVLAGVPQHTQPCAGTDHEQQQVVGGGLTPCQQQQQQRSGQLQQRQRSSTAPNTADRGRLQQHWAAHISSSRCSSSLALMSPAGFCSSAAHAAGASALEQSKAITRLLRESQDHQQLQQVVAAHASAFNAINIAAAFNRAASLPGSGSSGGAAKQQLEQQLGALWLQQLQHATPRELAGVLYACSKTAEPDGDLLRRTLAALLVRYDSINLQDAGVAAHALGQAVSDGAVPGVPRAEAAAALRLLASRLEALAAAPAGAGQLVGTASSGTRGGKAAAGAGSGRQRPQRDVAESVANVLMAHAKLGVQVGSAQQMSTLLQAMTPQLPSADTLSVVNTLWALSELQQQQGWAAVAALGQPVANAVMQQQATAAGAAGAGGSSAQPPEVPGASQLWRAMPAVVRQPPSSNRAQQQQRRRHEHYCVLQLPPELLSPQLMSRIAGASPQAVSNTLLALSRLSTGATFPRVLDVPTAQACMHQLLQGPTAQRLNGWNSLDVGNALWALAQAGVSDHRFLHAVADAAPSWLEGATATNLVRVAWGFARLKFKGSPQCIEQLVQHGKHLLHAHQHATRHQRHAAAGVQQDGAEAAAASSPEAQQAQELAERTACVLAWTITVLGQTQLAREIPELIRASGCKQQQQALQPADARMLWAVHAWLLKHRGHSAAASGGHGQGLERLLTEAQMRQCAAASRHTAARLTQAR